jgi:hypothetical protein
MVFPSFHRGGGCARSRRDRPVIDSALVDLKLGAWKDTASRHDRIHPDLAGNGEFLAEIIES